MLDSVPMTRERYNEMKAEVERLEQVEMPRAAEKIAAARAEGDLKENAEYHGAREEQGMLQAKINLIRTKLARAQIVDASMIPKDEVAFGATVRVRDLDLDEEQQITLVGAGDEDFDEGKFNITSPIGKGLLGGKVGEKVAIKVPRGTINYEILEIRYDD